MKTLRGARDLRGVAPPRYDRARSLDDAPLVTNDVLAFAPLAVRRLPSDEERRRLLIRDLVSWALVILIHLIIFFALVISLQQVRERRGTRGAVETMLDLSLLHRNNAPLVNVSRPDTEKQDRDISAKPLTVIPPVPLPPVIEETKPTPGDILGNVGRFLACGASSFEYLNPAQQARCTRQPWQALELPNGTLVLNTLPRLMIQDTGLPDNSGAAAVRQQAQTSRCSLLVNTPCLDDVFSGNRNVAPGIPAPN